MYVKPTYTDETRREVMFAMLDQSTPKAIQTLRERIVSGRIDGRYYSIWHDEEDPENNACILGTLAHFSNVPWETFQRSIIVESAQRDGYEDDSWAIEGYVTEIRPGQTPEMSRKLAQLLAWVDEYLAAKGGVKGEAAQVVGVGE
jgi:hypothetical protein